MRKVNIGKKPYKVRRDFAESSYVDGLWQDGYTNTITVKANIQKAFQGNVMRRLPEGDWTREAISINSNEKVYMARSIDDKLLKADVIEFDGALWEVRFAAHYENLRSTTHTEAIAIKVEGTASDRKSNC